MSNITDSRFKKANISFLLARVFKQIISEREQCLFYQISDQPTSKGTTLLEFQPTGVYADKKQTVFVKLPYLTR